MTDQKVEEFYEYVDEAYPEYSGDPRLHDIATTIVTDMAGDNAFQLADSEAHMYAEMLQRSQLAMQDLQAKDAKAEAERNQEAFHELPFDLNEPAPARRTTTRAKGRHAKIGAKFSGFQHFKETYYSNITSNPTTSTLSDTPSGQVDVYCPENSYCLFRCAEVYETLKPGFTTAKNLQVKINRHGINPYAAVKTKLLKRVKDHIPDFNINIRYIEVNAKGSFNYPLVNKNDKVVESSFFIGLYPTSIADTYHAILIRSTIKHLLTPAHLKFRMTRTLELTSEWKPVDKMVPSRREHSVIVYDIETYSHPIEIKGVVRRLQVPYSISWCILDLTRDAKENLESARPSEIYNISADPDDDYITDLRMYDRFLEDIYQKMALRNPQAIKPNEAGLEAFNGDLNIQCYAHNGSKFDNLYVKNARTARLLKQVGANSQLKSLKVEYVKHHEPNVKYDKKRHSSNMVVHFKDTCPFILAPLSSLSKRLPITCRKKEFDIANKSKFWFTDNDHAENEKIVQALIENTEGDRVHLENGKTIAKSIAFTAFQLNHLLTGRPEDWRDYLMYDIISLALVFEFAEKDFNTLGVSMTNACGLPGLAWQMIVKTSFAIQQDQIYYPVHPSMIELCRQATMGGRVICVKSYYKAENAEDGLICGDANSLYPSAMCNSFPVGEPQLLKKKDLDIDRLFITKPHFLVEIDFVIPAKDNSGNDKPFRFIPYREEKTGNLLYPGEGTYTGVYNEVDISEMIKEGYIVTKVHKGIYWEKTAAFMKDLVESMYAIRKQLVREGNPSEYVYKIMLNSMYGKFLETIKQTCKFYDAEYDEDLLALLKPQFEGDKLHPSGQYQHINYLENYIIKKPTYIGSYVLAHSRRIMNEYIRKIGIENIFYSDTDSIYTTRKCFEESGIVISEELGGIKNDYGEGCFIKEAIFLDQKKYLLRKTRLRGLGKEILEHGPESPDAEPVRYTYEEESTGARFLGIGVTIGEKIALQVSTRIGEKLGPVEKYNAVRDWYITMMHKSLCKPDTNDLASCTKIAREFWKRDTADVTIFKKEVCVSSNPLKRNELAKKSGLCYHYMSRPSSVAPILPKPKQFKYTPSKRGGEVFKTYQHMIGTEVTRTFSCLPLIVNSQDDYDEMTLESGEAEWDQGPTINEIFSNYGMDEKREVYYINRERVKLTQTKTKKSGEVIEGNIPDYVLDFTIPDRYSITGKLIKARKWYIPSQEASVVRYIRTVDSDEKPKYFKEVNVVYDVCKFGPSIKAERFAGTLFANTLHPVLFMDADVRKHVALGTVADPTLVGIAFTGWFKLHQILHPSEDNEEAEPESD